jgi:hypothetical protein
MSDSTETSATAPPYKDSASAPFVYFDLTGALGVMNGAVQIELASRILIPLPDGNATAEFVTTGHLRCSPTAAMTLRDAIDKTLQMLQQPLPQAVAPGKLN